MMAAMQGCFEPSAVSETAFLRVSTSQEIRMVITVITTTMNIPGASLWQETQELMFIISPAAVWLQSGLWKAYVIALGVNELYTKNIELGEISDIDLENYKNNKETFTGYYAQIISKIKELQPDAKIFLVNLPKGEYATEGDGDKHDELLHKMAELFTNTYLIDLRKYSPKYDADFKKKFFVGSHMSAAGYIRHNLEDFAQVGFIGTPHKFIWSVKNGKQ